MSTFGIVELSKNIVNGLTLNEFLNWFKNIDLDSFNTYIHIYFTKKEYFYSSLYILLFFLDFIY